MKIAICGKMCSGKSYVAKYLSLKYNCKIYSFGYAVKKYCKELFDMKYKDRILLQTFAEKMKEINKNVWINYIIKQIKELDNIIIDDLRFHNEQIELKKLGFIFIKLNINKKLQFERLISTYPLNYKEHLSPKQLKHKSETNIESLYSDLTININHNNENDVLCIIDDFIKID